MLPKLVVLGCVGSSSSRRQASVARFNRASGEALPHLELATLGSWTEVSWYFFDRAGMNQV